MPWNKVAFSSEDLSKGKEANLEKMYRTLWSALGSPEAAVMYSTERVERRGLECYFTPDAVKFAGVMLKRFGAIECAPPDVSHLAVTVRKGMA